MIRLGGSERSDEAWVAWRRECAIAQGEFNVAIADHDRSSDAPRPTASRDVYAKLKDEHYATDRAPFWGKCAYCELRIISGQPGDIEHFRPKARVSDRETNATLKTRDGSADHPGYYWLAYDWKNLLLACASCNRPHKRSHDRRRIGKWDHFPLIDESKRAEAPGQEHAEAPLLINPLIEDPAEHLAVRSSGMMEVVEGSARGKTCIEILGLNERGLPDERARVYEEAQRLYTELLIARLDHNDAKAKRLQVRIKEIHEGSRPHAIAARLALRQTEDFVRRPAKQ